MKFRVTWSVEVDAPGAIEAADMAREKMKGEHPQLLVEYADKQQFVVDYDPTRDPG